MSEGGKRLEAVLDLAVRLASGELDARLVPSDADDELDALILSLNMLAEELSHERRTRARAEELLADEIDTYEHAPGLFCSLDGETLIVEKCNQTLAKTLERSKQQILGASVLELCDPKCRNQVERLLRDSASDVNPRLGEFTLLTASNKTLIVATSLSRIRSEERSRLRIVWKDVTAEKHLEAQLLQAQKMDAIGRLSGGVAHDFNNILAVITTAAEFASDMLSDRALPLDDIQLILDASARGAALTNDLLAFSRQRVVQPVPTDLRVVVRDTERMIARLVGTHIRVDTDVSDQPIVSLIDPSQVAQVLLNLAINARDAMPNGGALRLEVGRFVLESAAANEQLGLAAGMYALIAVSDDGVGMTAEVAARAFEPFFTTKPVGKGTGLGLSMCYGIIHQAGGRISIYSEPAQGTTIRIYLPLVPEASQAAAVAEVAPAHGAEIVMLVEDDSSLRNLGKRVLERGGYRVLVAANGREALQVATQFTGKLALVVTDVVMPEMGGRELATALQTLRPETRILYVSGFTANVIVTQGALKPGIAFLAKPFTGSALLAAVRGVLDRKDD